MNNKILQNTKLFSLSRNAAKRIKFLLDQESKNCFFRLRVNGGGCSGFQYDFSFDKKKNNDDIVFKCDETEILIDEMSLSFLEGSSLEYIDDLSGSFFQVVNPNASSSCGCGTSFSI
jgi:iron-sulfur cluster insertion protein|tara:strand:+ start:275 stop:625 length:351 start_codon:yes stop_codon:yes gene_type:complete